MPIVFYGGELSSGYSNRIQTSKEEGENLARETSPTLLDNAFIFGKGFLHINRNGQGTNYDDDGTK